MRNSDLEKLLNEERRRLWKEVDRERFLDDREKLLDCATTGDPDALQLLAETATTDTFVLNNLFEQFALDSPERETLKEMTRRLEFLPIIYSGFPINKDKVNNVIRIGKNLPFRIPPDRVKERNKATHFVLDLVFQVLETGNLYRHFQQCPPQLSKPELLPDYAFKASRLEHERLTPKSLPLWWECVEAEFDLQCSGQSRYGVTIDVDKLGYKLWPWRAPARVLSDIKTRLKQELATLCWDSDEPPGSSGCGFSYEPPEQ
jgi:hypothetical protein